MSASFVVRTDGLRRLAAKFDDPILKQQLMNLVREKGIAAIIGQAIADNFDKEGPGWKPLKPQTIRQSISAGMRKRLIPGKYNTVKTKGGGEATARRILQRSGVLKKSVTTPGAKGNIFQVSGTNIVWGTNLKYAAIHNSGGIINHPGTDRGFGIEGLKIKPHAIPIPKREFLVIRDFWKKQILEFAVDTALRYIKQTLKRGG